MFRLLSCVVTVLLIGIHNVNANEPVITFDIAGSSHTEQNLSELISTNSAESIEFYNPLLGKVKRYQGIKIQSILDTVFGEQWHSKNYSDLAFIALDRYETITSIDILEESGGYLAVEDLDWTGGWEPIG